MKTLILILLFFFGNSCDPVTKESIETSSESIENTTPTVPSNQESMNPGEITFKIKIMEVYDSDTDICGISKTNVMKMSVQEVLEKGSSIVNLPKKNDEVLMNFFQAPKDLSENFTVNAKARESLCSDASKTYFTIFSYEIVE